MHDRKDNITAQKGRTSAVVTPSLDGKTGMIAPKRLSHPLKNKVRELQRRLALSAKTRQTKFYLLYDKLGYRDYPREYLTKILGLIDIRGRICYNRS